MSDLTEIAIAKKDAEEALALRDALVKLEKNAAFKKLILKEYFEKMPVEMVPLVSSPNEAASKGATNALIGIGSLQSFFNKVYRQGDHAEQALLELEQAELELVNEE